MDLALLPPHGLPPPRRAARPRGGPRSCVCRRDRG